jgi:hypothetical protein
MTMSVTTLSMAEARKTFAILWQAGLPGILQPYRNAKLAEML